MNGEFKYELEMRQDEERIARYFDNLPLFMDLPGENEAIFERIAKNSGEKVHQHDTLRDVIPEYDIFAEDEDFSRSDRSVFRPEEYEMLDILDSISLLYSERFAVSDDEKYAQKTLSVLCQSAKTLARISDLLYAEEEEIGLRSALAKRALHDINDLILCIRECSELSDLYSVEKEINILHIIRKKILNLLFELKKN